MSPVGKGILLSNALLGDSANAIVLTVSAAPEQGVMQTVDIGGSLEMDNAAMDAINSAMEMFSIRRSGNDYPQNSERKI